MKAVLALHVLVSLFVFPLTPAYAALDHALYKSVEQCIGCHPRTIPTHERNNPGSMNQQWPLDANGKMLCITCHECVTGTCRLRDVSPELCANCHDCSQGMGCVLGVAHLGNAPDTATLGLACLACHEGTLGRPLDGPGNHPVGVYYVESKGFRKVTDQRVVLAEGRVVCVSCHNPYHLGKDRLSKPNTKSRLCLSCHSK